MMNLVPDVSIYIQHATAADAFFCSRRMFDILILYSILVLEICYVLFTGIRWVSEIRFNNETFVQNMYIAPSDEYRNFIQRYSYLVC